MLYYEHGNFYTYKVSESSNDFQSWSGNFEVGYVRSIPPVDGRIFARNLINIGIGV